MPSGGVAATAAVVDRGSAGDWPPRSALVTGATGGIGGAVARRLLLEGSAVAAAGRDTSRLEELARAGATPVTADLTAAAGPAEVVDAAVDRVGSLDLVVAAAGIGLAGAFTEQSPAAIREVLELDLVATVLLVRAALPVLRDGGRIALVGSVSGALAPRGEAAYAAAKAGLGAFGAALRSELRDRRISVTVALPAVVDTEFFARRGRPAPRSAPPALTPGVVAERLLTASRRRRPTVYSPAWLGAVARFRGVAPGVYHRLADALGAQA